MGYVEKYPAQIDEYYGDDYYYQDTTSQVEAQTLSYGDYDTVAAVSLGWGIFLTPYLHRSGKILDVGCANGYFLRQLDRQAFERYGIEVNRHMAEQCQAVGITIIGTDVCASDLIDRYAESFDIITGFAVLEHIPNITRALTNIKMMLRPDGVFLFEVPLISEQYPNTVWFRSSLEHIYYPTVSGIEALFERVFGRWPAGQVTYIKDYGCTYVGMIAKEDATHLRLEQLFAYFFGSVPDELDPVPRELARFKFLFDVVYAADIERVDERVFAAIPPESLTQADLRRVFALWRRDIRGTAALQEATSWLQEQRARWEQVAKQQSDINAEEARRWQDAVQQEQQVNQQLREWIEQLEQAKRWLEDQRAAWQAKAEGQSAAAEQSYQEADLLGETGGAPEQRDVWYRLRRVGKRVRRLMRASSGQHR
jgi:SAM-dependent methyltransferase